MNKILITLTALLWCCLPASAMLIPTQQIGTAYNDGYWYQNDTGSSYLSPANRGGFAYGFSLDQAYHVSAIEGFLLGISDSNDQNGHLKFSIYQGSGYGHDNVGPFPSNTLVHTSSEHSVPIDGQSHSYSDETSFDLKPGEHWFGFSGGDGVMRADGYQLHGELASVHNPEPLSLLLFGGGIVAMSRLKKKRGTA